MACDIIGKKKARRLVQNEAIGSLSPSLINDLRMRALIGLANNKDLFRNLLAQNALVIIVQQPQTDRTQAATTSMTAIHQRAVD